MTDIRKIDRSALVDLKTVRISEDLPREERMRAFKSQIGDPNCFKVGKYVVCLSFNETGPTAQEIFSDLIRSKAGM